VFGKCRYESTYKKLGLSRFVILMQNDMEKLIILRNSNKASEVLGYGFCKEDFDFINGDEMIVIQEALLENSELIYQEHTGDGLWD
jgi:hypothetical protein